MAVIKTIGKDRFIFLPSLNNCSERCFVVCNSNPPHLHLKDLCVLLEKKSSSVLVPDKTGYSGDRNALLDDHVLESQVLGITLGLRRYDPCSLA